jgi:hypothetical protein
VFAESGWLDFAKWAKSMFLDLANSRWKLLEGSTAFQKQYRREEIA